MHRNRPPVGGPPDVAVVGAGAIGVSIALELARRGADVTVMERRSTVAAGCSYANAGFITPGHAAHYASRADLAKAGLWMLRRDSPFTVRLHPRLVPFAARLVRATSPTAAARIRAIIRSMAVDSLRRHAALASESIDTGFVQTGLIDVYGSQRRFQRALRGANSGPEADALGPRDLADFEPALVGPFAGAIYHREDAHCDPMQFVCGVADAAQRHGARFCFNTSVRRLTPAARGVSLETDRGSIAAETVVVAAGVWSRCLGAVPDRVPLEAGKGYSLDLDTGPGPLLRRPVTLRESRIALTPLGGRTRLSGTMAFEGLSERIDQPRVAAIHRSVVSGVLPGARGAPVLSSWAGLRPCTPDGLPYVGWLPAYRRRVAIAAGHAMLGLTLAPVTGYLIAELLEGRPNAELRALGVGRF